MIKNLFVTCVFISALFVTFTGCGKKVEKDTQSSAPTELKDSVVIVTIGVDSLNVLEVLKVSHEVNEVSSAMGTFVKGIDGVENNMSTFWFFEINGEMASKAADKIMTVSTDTIKWYYRQPGTEKPVEDTDTL
ncbi:MAG TPA: DUF4430 domain-containing protein [candidate division Zixibacteria bacterium]|nr:DUF4430 domain-containing protein [candidate division Zixibacteria bacterium]